jgi:hypothetical protein
MKFSPRLLPRKTLRARTISEVLDEFNIPLEPEVVYLELENCGVHPVTGYKLQALPQGFRDKQIWEVYTTSPLSFKTEGENTSPPEIEVKPNVWAVVIKADDWDYGIQSHTRFYVAEVNER